MPGAPRRSRRRRCPFCQTLFHSHPRLGARQWTCGAPACQQQRHAASCRSWRRRNRAVTCGHYQDYVQPARTRAAPKPVSPRQVATFLRGVRPEMRDAIWAQAQSPCGVRSP
jgi:hypothetical protein